MRSPTLNELPTPPAGKTGWPWTEESQPLPEMQPDGTPWPKISIVTPSYNQGQFIEETIRAVLLQGYPDIEYIIIDGGSQDETLTILTKYEPWLAYWVSEKDKGQADALNKGFGRATGQIFYWINSDDWPEKEVFGRVVQQFLLFQDVDVLYGDMSLTDQTSRVLRFIATTDFKDGEVFVRNRIAQPAVFFRSLLWRQFGPARESLHFIMDYELWLRWLLEGVRFKHFPGSRAFFRLHQASKTTNLRRIEQSEIISLFHELRDNGKLPLQYHPHIAQALNSMCRENYVVQDYEQFLITYNYYRKESSRFDPTLLLMRWLITFGKPFNSILLKIRTRLLFRT